MYICDYRQQQFVLEFLNFDVVAPAFWSAYFYAQLPLSLDDFGAYIAGGEL